MVQNARDVSRKTGANIEFLLNDYEFVFQRKPPIKDDLCI